MTKFENIDGIWLTPAAVLIIGGVSAGGSRARWTKIRAAEAAMERTNERFAAIKR